MSKYISGDLELRRKLKRLETKTSKDAIRKGTRAGAKITMAQARELVPVRSGKLRRSLKVRSLPRSRKWIGVTVRASAFYVQFVEGGTKKLTGRKFMRRAANETREAATQKCLEVMRVELAKGLM